MKRNLPFEVELPEGWLAKQMENVKKEVEGWPECMKALRHINDSITRHPSSDTPSDAPPRTQRPSA